MLLNLCTSPTETPGSFQQPASALYFRYTEVVLPSETVISSIRVATPAEISAFTSNLAESLTLALE